MSEILAKIKDALGEAVQEVRLTGSLGDYPVSLTSAGELSIEMEKAINAMPVGEKVKAQLALEINANHEIVDKLKAAAEDEEKLGKYAKILYFQARLVAGLPAEDPAEMSNLICELM